MEEDERGEKLAENDGCCYQSHLYRGWMVDLSAGVAS